MKTLEDIDEEIAEIQAKFEYPFVAKDKKEQRKYNKACARMKFLSECRAYLELDPNPKYVRQEYDICCARVDQIDVGFDTWCINNPFEARKETAKNIYNKEANRAVYSVKALHLEYILFEKQKS